MILLIFWKEKDFYMTLNNIILNIEMADTPEKQTAGLMFRKKLDDDAGMCFSFLRPQILKFWGKNTLIPLDIAFVSHDNKIVNIERIMPFDLKEVCSKEPCCYAIETNIGFFDKNKISSGHTIKIDKDRNKLIISKKTKDDID